MANPEHPITIVHSSRKNSYRQCGFHTTISIYFNLKLNWDQDPNRKTLQASEHSATACLLLLSTHVFPPPCLVISYTQISKGPSHHKSKSFNSKYEYHSTSQSIAENHLPMYEPLPSSCQSHSQNDPKTLPGPRPSLSAASTVAPAEITCSTTAASPFQAAACNAVPPRAPRMRRRRRGCSGCRRERHIAIGCFSGWLGCG